MVSKRQVIDSTTLNTIIQRRLNEICKYKSLKDRQKEINEEIEYKNTQSLSDELYEIEDTLKKLGVNENNTVNFN